MKDRVFLDTNVLIYLYSESESKKRKLTLQILNSYYSVTSIQALNEASNVWFKKYGWDGTKIREHLDNIKLVCDEILITGHGTINTALSLKDRYGYLYYDCLMLAAALESNCSTIMTEDMNNGQVINSQLYIRDPFIIS